MCVQGHVVQTHMNVCMFVFVYLYLYGVLYLEKYICVCALARRTNSYVHVASFELFDHLLCTRAKNALQ